MKTVAVIEAKVGGHRILLLPVIAPVGLARVNARLVAEVGAVRGGEEGLGNRETDVECRLVVGVVLARPPRPRRPGLTERINDGIRAGRRENRPGYAAPAGGAGVRHLDGERFIARQRRGQVHGEDAPGAAPAEGIASRHLHRRYREHVVRVEFDRGERVRAARDRRLEPFPRPCGRSDRR